MVSQVLDELGLQLNDTLSNLPQASASLSVAGGKVTKFIHSKPLIEYKSSFRIQTIRPEGFQIRHRILKTNILIFFFEISHMLTTNAED